MSTCVATGNTVCYDGERNGLDNAWPGALVLDSVCVFVCVCVKKRLVCQILLLCLSFSLFAFVFAD